MTTIYPSQFETIGLVYCDPNEDPIVWTLKAERFLQNRLNRCATVVFVGRPLQLQSVPTTTTTSKFILVQKGTDWLDTPKVKDFVNLHKTKIRVLDHSLLLSDIQQKKRRGKR